MVDYSSLELKDFGDIILDMKIKDFCTLCAENHTDYSVLISGLTVCSFNLLCQMALDKKNKK